MLRGHVDDCTFFVIHGHVEKVYRRRLSTALPVSVKNPEVDYTC